MRPIKFRGKRLSDGQWIYGSLVQFADGTAGIYTDIVAKDEYDLPIHIPPTPVDPKTVGQFTGMYDRNGIEIYEGDLLLRDLDDLKILVEYETSEYVGFSTDTNKTKSLRQGWKIYDRAFGEWSIARSMFDEQSEAEKRAHKRLLSLLQHNKDLWK